MELNVLSILIGTVGLSIILYIFWWIAGWLKNVNRYDRPKFLPRDDEVAWSMVMASPKRIWDYRVVDAISFDNWDLGILKVDPKRLLKRYGTRIRICDVVLVPRKWGGYWAVAVTKKLLHHRYVTTFLGDYHNERIRRGRNKEDFRHIS